MKVVSNTAVSLDGRINTRERRFTFFGSARDHARMSRLRAEADAVLVGGATFRNWPHAALPDPADRPLLKSRPWNVVVSRSLDVPLTPSFLAGTRGPKGTIWLDEQGDLQETPAFPVHTVDTLGAGDVFHGAFALAITEKQGLRDALRFASAAAALKCTRHGGAFAAPQRAEVTALLGQGQAARPA